MELKYRDQILTALGKIAKINSDMVDGNSKIMSDFHLESIDFVDFIFLLEKETNIQIDISDLSIRFAEETGKKFSDLTIMDIDLYLRRNINE